jgi:hypothetical protein
MLRAVDGGTCRWEGAQAARRGRRHAVPPKEEMKDSKGGPYADNLVPLETTTSETG